MGKQLGRHERCTIGECLTQAFTGAAARITLVAASGLAGKVPVHLLVYGDQDVQLRQGDSSVVADGSDFILPKKTPILVTVESAEHAYLSVITPSGGTNGTVYVVRTDSTLPGNDNLTS